MIIKNSDFDLTDTFECGQCFRWNAVPDNTYIGVVGKSVIKVKQHGNEFDFDCDDKELINAYFDFERDYSKLKSVISDMDSHLKKAVSEGGGIRLLRQEPWETLVSFIISANNNIPRIKKIIESLCLNFGEPIKAGNDTYYSFPSAKALSGLSVEDLGVIRSGFRAKYILDAAKKVNEGEVLLDKVYAMPTEEAREYLKKIKGVGDKVADCILLFAYQKYDVFPKDVWTKRVLHELYGIEEADFNSFVTSHFGELAGFAQQYLFYNIRG